LAGTVRRRPARPRSAEDRTNRSCAALGPQNSLVGHAGLTVTRPDTMPPTIHGY
jgi:hypothetical protein